MEPTRIEVDLDGERHRLAWHGGQRMLDALLAAGLDAPYSCREGRCGACACRLLEGRITMAHNEILDDGDLADGLILACQSLPAAAFVRISYD